LLEHFIACFNREKLTVDDPDERVVLPALLGEIWPHSPFMAKLARRTPTTISNFGTKAEEFINVEKTIKAFAEQANQTKGPDCKRKHMP